MRTVGYLRVSTNEQGRSGLGLEAQRATIDAEAARRGWAVEFHEEVASGARSDRPVLNALVDGLSRGDVLVCARMDRLTRSLLDFVTLVRRAEREGWSLVVLDQSFDLATPAGRMVAGMLAVFGEYERELISARTSAALRSLPRERRGGGLVYPDEVISAARDMRDSGTPYWRIARSLEAMGFSPPRGERIHASAVRRMLLSAE